MKVRAKGEADTWVGFYHHVRRRGGDVFALIPVETVRNGKPVMIPPERQFSEKWMEKVEESLPESKPAHFNVIGKGQPRIAEPEASSVSTEAGGSVI